MKQTAENIIIPDHTWGKRNSGEQAKLVLRWETRSWWEEICQRLGCNEAVARVVIALWCEHISAGRWTSYSRNREHYEKFHNLFYTKHLVVSAAEWLDRAGLIFHWVQEENVRDWQSCMKAKPSLILTMQDIVAKLGRPIPAMPREQIILCNARGESLSYRETRATRAMCRQVDHVNEMLLAADLSCSLAAVNRIFNETMDRGGRWYAIGGAWQQMSEIERGRILIDGQKTIELDIKTQHAAMIFTDAGLSVPDDAYDIPGYERELVKVGFLVLVNAKSEKEAVGAIAGKDEIGFMAEPDTKDAFKAARSLMKVIKSRHEAILHAFHSDAGAGLMRRDSEIAGHVLTTMTKKGITVLPVHDSFIVKETAQEVLEEVMREATALAGLPDVRIELKVPKAKSEPPKSMFADVKTGVQNCKPDSTISMGSEPLLTTYPPVPVSLPLPSLASTLFLDSESNLDSSESGAVTDPKRSRLSYHLRAVVPVKNGSGDLVTVDPVSTFNRKPVTFYEWLEDPTIDAADVHPHQMAGKAIPVLESGEVGLQSSDALTPQKSILMDVKSSTEVEVPYMSDPKDFAKIWKSVRPAKPKRQKLKKPKSKDKIARDQVGSTVSRALDGKLVVVDGWQEIKF